MPVRKAVDVVPGARSSPMPSARRYCSEISTAVLGHNSHGSCKRAPVARAPSARRRSSTKQGEDDRRPPPRRTFSPTDMPRRAEPRRRRRHESRRSHRAQRLPGLFGQLTSNRFTSLPSWSKWPSQSIARPLFRRLDCDVELVAMVTAAHLTTSVGGTFCGTKSSAARRVRRRHRPSGRPPGASAPKLPWPGGNSSRLPLQRGGLPWVALRGSFASVMRSRSCCTDEHHLSEADDQDAMTVTNALSVIHRFAG